MKILKALLAIILSILDRFPSRREALLNAIEDVRHDIKELQQKDSPWTVVDSGKYSVLLDKLSKLEKRLLALG